MTPEFKVRAVLESFQRDSTIEEVCRRYGIASSVLNRWRKQFRENAVRIFLDKRNLKNRAISAGFKPGESPEDLKRIIGELTIEKEILKKACGLLGLK